MIVPRYWSESRLQHRDQKGQVTVRRFGWSDFSQDEADAVARQRCESALRDILAGAPLPRRERRVAYNGAEGVPIREEIVETFGDVIITRNGYGARCLNTPNVFFADIDYSYDPGCLASLAAFAIAMIAACLVGSLTNSTPFFVIAVILTLSVSHILANWLLKAYLTVDGGPELAARKTINSFLARHPDWRIRLYETPAGMRILALHQTFSPEDPVVAEAFAELGTDPVYMKMCLRQNCFRARVSPKPWRIGIERHIRPQTATWPLPPEKLPARAEWIESYEAAAEAFASCKFLEELGSGTTDSTAQHVANLHDELCRATADLPIA